MEHNRHVSLASLWDALDQLAQDGIRLDDGGYLRFCQLMGELRTQYSDAMQEATDFAAGQHRREGIEDGYAQGWTARDRTARVERLATDAIIKALQITTPAATEPADTTSYDDKQLAAVLVRCEACGRARWMTTPQSMCVECQDARDDVQGGHEDAMIKALRIAPEDRRLTVSWASLPEAAALPPAPDQMTDYEQQIFTALEQEIEAGRAKPQ